MVVNARKTGHSKKSSLLIKYSISHTVFHLGTLPNIVSLLAFKREIETADD